VGVVLAVDFGTSNTTAALLAPGERPELLTVDGLPVLPSAVYADDTGLLAGAQAVNSAARDPARYAPNPKRHVDESTLLLGPREVPVHQAIGAVLGRVAEAARHRLGRSPERVVLTHPHTWAGPRLQVLRRSAYEAGLTTVELVAEPVAAAARFVAEGTGGVADGRGLGPGATVVVYDLGGGTFDVSVLRRRAAVADPARAWEICAYAGLDVGGVDFDHALLGWIERQLGPGERPAFGSLTDPRSVEDRKQRRLLLDDVRRVKEDLSGAAEASVFVPLLNRDIRVTRTEFEALIMPNLVRTVELTAQQLRGVKPDKIFMIGGSSRIPLVATLLWRHFEVAPAVPHDPAFMVAFGALESIPVAAPATPEPGPPDPTPPAPVRRFPLATVVAAGLGALGAVLAWRMTNMTGSVTTIAAVVGGAVFIAVHGVISGLTVLLSAAAAGEQRR
jgi:molecular chaperone DnaK